MADPKTKDLDRAQVGCAVILCIMIVAWIVLSVGSCMSSASSAPRKMDTPSLTAWHMSKRFAERELKAPTTAKWPSHLDPEVSVEKLGGRRYLVRGYVDSQNSFGAMIRTRFSVEMQYHDETDKWSAGRISWQ